MSIDLSRSQDWVWDYSLFSISGWEQLRVGLERIQIPDALVHPIALTSSLVDHPGLLLKGKFSVLTLTFQHPFTGNIQTSYSVSYIMLIIYSETFFRLFYLLHFLFMYSYAYVYGWAVWRSEDRQLVEVGSLLQPRDPRVLNSNSQTWLQASIPIKLSEWPRKYIPRISLGTRKKYQRTIRLVPSLGSNSRRLVTSCVWFKA